MTQTRILASIYPHEQEAMRKLVQAAYVFARSIEGTRQSIEVRIWAQMIEDVLHRIEQEEIA